MTLQEAKDQAAQQYGFIDYSETYMTKRKDWSINAIFDTAAELYARSKWDECYEETISNINWPYQETTKPEFKP